MADSGPVNEVCVIAVGSVAPDFALPNQARETVRLSGFQGHKHVVLAFHPLAFTPVCSTQVKTYDREHEHLEQLDAVVLVISTDAGPSKRAWADALGVSLPMLSDFHPQGQVALAYGVLGPHGLADRAVVVIDKAGVVRWTKRYGMDEHPSANDVLDALRAL